MTGRSVVPPAIPETRDTIPGPEAPPYRWVILTVCSLLVALNSVTWHSFSLFLVALQREFGWARGEIALGFLVFVVCFGLTGPFAGYLFGRFGGTRVMIGGGVILTIGLVATSRVTSLWQFYVAFGLIVSTGLAISGWVPIVTLIQTWFRRRIAPVMGVVGAGAGLGIMALVPATQFSIERSGWRTTYLLMAGLTFAAILVLAPFLRTGPLSRLGGAPRGDEAPAEDPSVVDPVWVSRPWSLRLAFREPRYLFFWAGVFLTTFASQQVMSHQAAYLSDAGYPLLMAASIAGVIGVASVPAKIGWGLLSDRIGREPTFTLGALVTACALVTMWLVPFLGVEWLPYLYAVLIGAGYAISAVLSPTIASDMFRGASYGAIFGGLQTASSIGSGVGSWLAGIIFDQTGSYYIAFAIAIAGALGGALCIWLAAPRRVRRVPGQIRQATTEPRRAVADLTATG